MTENKDTVTPQNIVDFSVKGIQEKKGSEIKVLNLREIGNSVADFFVICTGNSDTQIDAIADSIEKEIHNNCNQNPWRREGKQNKEWVLLDYVDVVVHIFKRDIRNRYGIEELWGDAIVTEIE